MREGFKRVWVVLIGFFLMQNVFAMDCKTIGSRCIDGPEEREVDGYRVFKDCWKYEDSFECKYPSEDNCQTLREQGCTRITQKSENENIEECIKKYGTTDKCLNYQKNYVCYKEVEVTEEQERIRLINKKQNKKVKCTKDIKCLDGSCFSSESDEEKEQRNLANNQDMLNAITQMTAARDMAKDQVLGKEGESIVSVFKGEDMRCRKNKTLKFRDCCGIKPGWGVKIGLARCNADAKAMLERREAGHCVDLGTYCAEKWPLVGCVAHKQTYCCFSGKLQRIIHEQGRRDQLGISLGSAEHPDCRGVTVEELSSLNFDKINFKEFFEEVEKKYQMPDMKSDNQRVSDAFSSIQEDFKKSDGENIDPKDKKNQVPFRNKKFKSEVIDEETGISSHRSHM